MTPATAHTGGCQEDILQWNQQREPRQNVKILCLSDVREFWIPKKKKHRNCDDPAADDLSRDGDRIRPQ